MTQENIQILQGDVFTRLKELPDQSVHCVVTSPPYFGLRDYGVEGQIGLESTPEAFIETMVRVFREVHRVLRDDGTLWLNIGDTYTAGGRGGGVKGEKGAKQRSKIGALLGPKKAPDGYKAKDLLGIPWMLAFALRADGWYLRSDIIWSKPNPMPESVTDRPTKAHEYIFLFSKKPKYFYDAFAIRTLNKDPKDTHRRLTKAHTGQAKSMPDEFHYGIRPRIGSTLKGGDYGRHFLGEAIPKKERRSDKQRGHSRRHAGFNDRWDAMDRNAQISQGANRRSVWQIATQPFPEAHFATFPVVLPTLCIKAGTSECGVCSMCGAPWARIVKKSIGFASGSGRSGNTPKGKNDGGEQTKSGDYDIRLGPIVASVDAGWCAGCRCVADPIPATVLDPFSGAATTGIACLRLGRKYLGIELSPEYVEMSIKRIEKEITNIKNPPRPERKTIEHGEINSLFKNVDLQ